MRIMIFGRPGSGKSTCAVKLSQQLRIPVYHLDKYFYKENWQERNYQDFLHIQQELIAQDSWIIDGNNTKSLEMRYARANVVLYFKYSRLICLWRIFKRLWYKDAAIQDRAKGCQETVRWQLIRYMWSFDQRVSAALEHLQAQYPAVKLYVVQSDVQLKRIVNKLLVEKHCR